MRLSFYLNSMRFPYLHSNHCFKWNCSWVGKRLRRFNRGWGREFRILSKKVTGRKVTSFCRSYQPLHCTCYSLASRIKLDSPMAIRSWAEQLPHLQKKCVLQLLSSPVHRSRTPHVWAASSRLPQVCDQPGPAGPSHPRPPFATG